MQEYDLTVILLSYNMVTGMNLKYDVALSPADFHSQLITEVFKLPYPDSTPAPPHDHHQ